MTDLVIEDDIQVQMSILNEKIQLLNTGARKVNEMAATMKIHFCKKNKDMCSDISVLANGVIKRTI